MELLVANLSRMNEEEDSDRQGIYHTLGIFENSIGFNPALADTVVSKTSIMTWLLARTQAKTHDENRGYASELLAILLQGNKENRVQFGKVDGVDILLRVLSVRRCLSLGILCAPTFHYSNIEEEIPGMLMRSSSWRTFSILSAQLYQSPRINNYFWMAKAVGALNASVENLTFFRDLLHCF
jgi:Catenin-beta-like, Arm-motif containing nuclear